MPLWDLGFRIGRTPLTSTWHCKSISSTSQLVCAVTSLSLFRRNIKREKEIAKEETNPVPHVDYSLKEGQKISLNIGVSMGPGGNLGYHIYMYSINACVIGIKDNYIPSVSLPFSYRTN